MPRTLSPDPRWLLLAVVVSAALTIAGGSGGPGPGWLPWVFKPLTTLLVIAYAATRAGDVPRRRRWVLAGLAWSLAGDVALLWPQSGFIFGLVSFLIAHLCYVAAFTATTRFGASPSAFATYAVVSAAILSQLWPHVPAGLRLPVLAYVVCLAAMAAQAAAWWWTCPPGSGRRGAGLAAVGGALFLASDTLLAFNKFAEPLPLASLWVLSTYWSAQWCIASALRPRAAG
ncbi:lysoplasmalogenase [Caldimonas thermodepolymerans]|nr:lysoplasmalogenase [Caldimonas thermodepolymerans]QPC31257.1 lysoplasmalogenase [Caldimonas thermodepolymerans]RDH99780.1 putative membrane protein YhhN [Caldimonas thermodepolymerans]